MTDAGALATLDRFNSAYAGGVLHRREPSLAGGSSKLWISVSSGATATLRAVPYVMFGAIAGARFGDYQAGIPIQQLSELIW